jgi:hypothetical protein
MPKAVPDSFAKVDTDLLPPPPPSPSPPSPMPTADLPRSNKRSGANLSLDNATGNKRAKSRVEREKNASVDVEEDVDIGAKRRRSKRKVVVVAESSSRGSERKMFLGAPVSASTNRVESDHNSPSASELGTDDVLVGIFRHLYFKPFVHLNDPIQLVFDHPGQRQRQTKSYLPFSLSLFHRPSD